MNRPAADQKLLQIMDATFADAAQRAGSQLACKPGCAQCCMGVFTIHALDVARLQEGINLLRNLEPDKAIRVDQRTQAWMAAFRADFPGDLETGVLGKSEEEQERFADFANESVCTALDPDTGLCDLYEYRPMTCRVFGPPVRMEGEDGDVGLGYCELCFQGASEAVIAACEMQPPHEQEAEIVESMENSQETILPFALFLS